jgi:hypothetical protein
VHNKKDISTRLKSGNKKTPVASKVEMKKIKCEATFFAGAKSVNPKNPSSVGV